MKAQAFIFFVILWLGLGRTPQVAIVGSGVSGSVSSMLLRQKFGDNIDIHVYERQTRVGGRIHTYKASDNQFYEVGAAFAHKENRYVKQLASYAGVETIKIEDLGSMGIWDGKQIVYESNSYVFLSALLSIWRYGFNNLNTVQDLVEENMHKLDDIYSSLASGQFYSDVGGMFKSIKLYDLTQKNFSSYLDSKIEKNSLLANELIGGINRANYNQRNGNMNAFAGLVSITPVFDMDLFVIKGGYQQMIEKALEKAKVNKFLNDTVREIVKKQNKFKIISTGSGNGQEFDAVIIATPLETSGTQNDNKEIKIQDQTATTSQRAFQTVYSAFLSGKVNAKSFASESVPLTLIVTDQAQTLWNELKCVKSQKNSQICKVFSTSKLSSSDLTKMFESHNQEYIYEWQAYPVQQVYKNLGSFNLTNDICYVNAIESTASCLEVVSIGAANCVNLLNSKLQKVKEEDDKKQLEEERKRKEEEERKIKEEEERKRQEEERKKKEEEERKRKEEEERKRKEEEERKRKEEEERKRKEEEERKRKEEEEARKRKEEEDRKLKEEEDRKKKEEEDRRLKEEEDRKLKEEEDRKKKEEEDRRLKEEEERKRKEEEDRKLKEEEDRKKKEEEDRRLKEEEDRKRKEEEDRKKKEEEDRRLKEEEDRKRKEEEDRKKKEEEDRKKKEEEDRRLKEEEDRKRKEEEDRKKKEEEDRRLKEEEDRKRKEEEDRKKKEEEDRKKKEEEDRRLKEEEDRKRKEEEDRKKKQEEERRLKEEEDRKLKEEEDRKKKEEEDRKLKEEEDRKLKEEEDRKKKEEEERKLQEEEAIKQQSKSQEQQSNQQQDQQNSGNEAQQTQDQQTNQQQQSTQQQESTSEGAAKKEDDQKQQKDATKQQDSSQNKNDKKEQSSQQGSKKQQNQKSQSKTKSKGDL